MKFTIKENTQFNSKEVYFDDKPDEETRNALKGLNFRWHRVKGCWYGYASEEQITGAINREATAMKTKPTTKANKPDQNRIRIYYNGIVLDGDKIQRDEAGNSNLINCYFSLNNNTKHKPSVSIYVHYNCGHPYNLPRDLLPVVNESDGYTDYFEEDHAHIEEDHPLFKYFYYAGLKARANGAKKQIKYIEKRLSDPRCWCPEAYKKEIEQAKQQINEFETATDPGQPTAADLEKIDRANQEAENRRREEEHKADLERREEYLRQRSRHYFITETAEKYPITDGAPVVMINWSEHPAFYIWGDNELTLSVKAAEIVLKALDEELPENSGYFKTKFTITTDDENSPLESYTGRYDLGDHGGGLIEHIFSLGEWYRTHDGSGWEATTINEKPEETNDIIKYSEYLNTFCA